ncbi:unnamed protein product [Rotaria sp. Silwood2]|nr:unnamed protein product [Rotaria sp. Silwood2]
MNSKKAENTIHKADKIPSVSEQNLTRTVLPTHLSSGDTMLDLFSETMTKVDEKIKKMNSSKRSNDINNYGRSLTASSNMDDLSMSMEHQMLCTTNEKCSSSISSVENMRDNSESFSSKSSPENNTRNSFSPESSKLTVIHMPLSLKEFSFESASLEYMNNHHTRSKHRAIFQMLDNVEENEIDQISFVEAVNSYLGAEIYSADVSQPIKIYHYDADPLESTSKIPEYSNLETYSLLWCDEKINGVLDTPAALVNQITANYTDLRKAENDALPLTIFKPSAKTHLNLTNENSKFIWFQLFIEVLIRMKDDNLRKSIEDIIFVCDRNYRNNSVEEKILQQLEEAYTSVNAVWWYTGETFIYRILNRALNRQDFEVLLVFRFLIRDLYQQLANEQQKFDVPVVTVYRGQIMIIEELESLKTNETKFISFNKLLSTSLNRRVAISHAKIYNKDIRKTSVLFEIEANTRLHGAKPFANVTHLSQFEMEQEVLFMAGSVFKILDISKNENEKLSIIKLVLSGTEDNNLRDMFEIIKQEIPEETNISTVGDIFFQMGKYDQAKRYYKRLVKLLPETHPDISVCYINMGTVANETGDAKTAYSLFTKALELELSKSSLNQLRLCAIFNCLGTSTNDYNAAIDYHNQALDIHLKIFGYYDSDTAGIYINLGNDYLKKNDYDSALLCYNKALDILTKVLPDYHPTRAVILMCVANLHYKKSEYDLALDNYQKALSIQLACASDHIEVGKIYKILADIHSDINTLNEALFYYRQALAVYEKASLNTYHTQIIEILTKIAGIHKKNENYELAIKDYEKLLSIQLAYLPLNDLSIAWTYKEMSFALMQQRYIMAALNCVYKVLYILESNSFPSDHPHIIWTKKLINEFQKIIDGAQNQ